MICNKRPHNDGVIGHPQLPWQQTAAVVERKRLRHRAVYSHSFRGKTIRHLGTTHNISCFIFSASSFSCSMWLCNSLQLFLSKSKVCSFSFIYFDLSALVLFHFVCGKSQPWYSTCGRFLYWFFGAQPFLPLTVCIVGGRMVLMDCCPHDMVVFWFLFIFVKHPVLSFICIKDAV